MSFDWTTFVFQLVNVAVLLAILGRFLFRPVAAVIARRQAETDAALKAAKAARAEAQEATEKARAEAAATASARHDVLEQAQAEAGAARKALLDKAQAEAARVLADGRATLEREAAAGAQKTVAQARDLAGAMARRALSSQPPDLAGYLARLVGALTALPPEERAAILGGDGLTLVSAAPLAGADLDAARSALAPFGVTPDAATDPQLMAGLELRSASGAIRNSLAHDLDLIAAAMRDGAAAGAP